MTRHQRRKAAKAKALVKSRQEIVRRNLSTPLSVERSEHLISGVYANRMDRARGRGTTPIHRIVTRVIGRDPTLGGAHSTKTVWDSERRKMVTVSVSGCGWKAD